MSDTMATPIADSIGDFARLVAAGTPTPGGGSVAAYCGMLAVALGEMMCNITIGKQKYEAVESRVKCILEELRNHGARFRDLIDEDAVSFDSVLIAYKLPKDSEEQKAARRKQIEEAAVTASRVPFETAEHGLAVLKLMGELAEIANPNALPDLTIGGVLAEAAVKGAYYNIGINLKLVTDPQITSELRSRAEILLEQSEVFASEIETELLTIIS